MRATSSTRRPAGRIGQNPKRSLLEDRQSAPDDPVTALSGVEAECLVDLTWWSDQVEVYHLGHLKVTYKWMVQWEHHPFDYVQY